VEGVYICAFNSRLALSRQVARPDDAEPETDPNAAGQYKAQDFVKDALSVKITPMQLDQFAAEWDNQRREQDAHALELDNLRRFNAQLSLQVRSLEASLAQINEEHVCLPPIGRLCA
jgi:hypothetical protein